MEYRRSGMGERTLAVTEARSEDVDEVRELLVRANESYRDRLPAEAFEPYLAMVTDLGSRTGVASLLLVRGPDRLLGTVTFFRDASAEGWGSLAGEAGLRAMAVEPTRRREG